MNNSLFYSPILPGFSWGEFMVVVFVVVLIFLVGREINAWYWKINEIVSLLQDIKKNTDKHKESVELGTEKTDKNH